MEKGLYDILKKEANSIEECKQIIGEIDRVIGMTTEGNDALVERIGKMHQGGEMETDIFEFFISMIDKRVEMTTKIKNGKKVVRIKSSIRKTTSSNGNNKRVRFL